MYEMNQSIPKMGEIRIGKVDLKTDTHKYYGIHPYLVISNNCYNEFSGQCEVIPFTTKRFNRSNPVHVDFRVGEVEGLDRESTLVIEARDTIRNESLGEPIGHFSEVNWNKVTKAIMVQNPFMQDFMT